MKHWYTSKTIWTNTIAAVFGLTVLVAGLTEALGHDVIANNGYATLIGGVALAMANAALRFLTEEPVENPFTR